MYYACMARIVHTVIEVVHGFDFRAPSLCQRL